MNKSAVGHKVDSEFAYAVSKNQLMLKVKVGKNECLKVEVLYVDKYKYLFHNEKTVWTETMTKKYSDVLFDYYEAIVNFEVLSLGYCFKFYSEEEILYYGNYKFSNVFSEKSDIATLKDFFTMPVIDLRDIFEVPKWAENSIVYQIFPERFYRGDNYVENENHQDWHGKLDFNSFLGGNLYGIIDKLDYLEELGIGAIYLNPIFRAGYNHKYCTYDYMEIDPEFGTLETLKELVTKAHSKGIKIVLDAVFSSSGTEFDKFKDIVEKNEESKFADWYKIDKFPVEVKSPANYKCFAYFPMLPKFNYESEELQQYFFNVLSYWIKEADIDGWRLDVADEIPHYFWKRAREVVKTVKKEAVLIGEIWYDSTAWLMGDQLDSVMNYRFYGAVMDFIGKTKIDAYEFSYEISRYLAEYKVQTHKLLWNLIDSHDTMRFRNLLEENRDKKQKLAAVIQFTMVGTPVIYYGDEVGLEGGNDPDNRRGMLWGEKQDLDMLGFYKKLIAMRKRYLSLSSGNIRFEVVSKNVLKYIREIENEKIEVYINNSSDAVEIKNSEIYWDVFGEGEVRGDILLEGFGFRVLKWIVE